jgi:anti-sigma factor RsiW
MMTVEEARSLLSYYADGLLEPEKAQELEALLAKAPELEAEYRTLKEENSLLSEALKPLRPSQSTRIRLSDAMVEIHERAAQEADHELAERKRRITHITLLLIVLALMAILAAAIFYHYYYEHRKGSRDRALPTLRPETGNAR